MIKIVRIDPHYSADHADLFFQGYRYFIADTYPIVPQYPITEHDYEKNRDKVEIVG